MEDKDKKHGGLKVQSSVVTNWNEVPSEWKNTTPIKKVKFTNSPYDKALLGIFKTFFSNDEYRPIMTGIHFDKNGIVATDAHQLMSLPFPNKSYLGTYKTPIFDALAKKKSSSLSSYLKGDLIEGKYPNYEAVIPLSKNMSHKKVIDVYKLLQYTRVAIKYSNTTTNQVKFRVGNSDKFGLNGKILIDCLEALLKLGHERVYFHYNAPNKACILSPNKDYVVGKDEIVLIMPVMLGDSGRFGAEDIDYGREITVYFDVSKNEIINGDGSVAKFQMTYPNNSVIPLDAIKMLHNFTKLKHTIPILEYFSVKDGKAMASDLENSVVLFVDSRIPNSLYQIKDNAIELEKHQEQDNFVKFPEIEPKDYVAHFTIDTDYFKYVLSKAVTSLSKDELRPALGGFCLDRKGDDLFLVATNAHTLFKMNMKDYVDFKSKEDFTIILQKGLMQQFLEFTQSKSITIKSTKRDSIIESKEGTYISRNIDQRYPNYEGVIRQYSEFALTLDIKELKDCLEEKIAIDFIKKHKAQTSGSIIAKKIDETRAEIMIIAMDSTGNYAVEVDRIKICEIIYQKKQGNFASTDSVALLMPKRIEEEVIFCFAIDFFHDLLDVCSSDKIEMYEKQKSEAYIVPYESIAYENTSGGKSNKSINKSPSRQLKSDKAKAESLKPTVEPKQEVKEPIVIEEVVAKTEGGSEKDFLTDKIEAFKMMLDIEDDKKEIAFLNDKIEAFELMLEMDFDIEEPQKESSKKKS
jgi:DNA polymerase III sliding clamp (beta) subunit (PCNA family)